MKGETREITEFVEFPENKERAEGLEGMVDLARRVYMAKKEILANAAKMVPRVSLAAQELKVLWELKVNREKLVKLASKEKLGLRDRRVVLGPLEQSERQGFLDNRGQVESLVKLVNRGCQAKWDYQDLLAQPGKMAVLGQRVLKGTTASMVSQEVGVS